MKEQEFSVKSTIYRDKLRSYMFGNSFLKIASKKLGRDLIPKISQETIHVEETEAFSE